jgi:hypothetical protein
VILSGGTKWNPEGGVELRRCDLVEMMIIYEQDIGMEERIGSE